MTQDTRVRTRWQARLRHPSGGDLVARVVDVTQLPSDVRDLDALERAVCVGQRASVPGVSFTVTGPGRQM